MKTQTLIIQLGSKSNVLDSAHFIAEFIRKNSNHEVNMLTFKDSKKAAHLIKGVKKVFVIDREEINNILNNRLYSDAFALNNFQKNLKRVFDTKWDHVINLSNSDLSYYLTSTFDAQKIIGGFKKLDKSTHFSSLWSSLPQTLLSKLQLAPLKTIHTQIRATGLSYQQRGIKLITNEKNNQIAFQNINKIRQSEHTATDAKVIGITISSARNATLNLQQLTELLDHIFSTPDYIPLLIIESGNESQKKIVNHLNKDFENSLLSVESDEVALPSLLINLDMIISDDFYYTTSASLVNTPTLRVTKDVKTVFCQHTHTLNDLIFVIGEDFRAIELINGVDNILKATKYTETSFGQHTVVFRVANDFQGSYPQLEIGSKFNHAVLTGLAQRYYLTSQTKNADNTLLMNYLLHYFNQDIPSWSHIQKDHLMKTTKRLLRCLRLLVNAKADSKSGALFLNALDELLNSYAPTFLTAIPLALFEYNLQKITSDNTSENLIIMEHLLYDLKNSLQKVMTTLSLIESKNRSINRDEKTEAYCG